MRGSVLRASPRASHRARNLARGDEACTVRTGGAWRAGVVLPDCVRCVHSTVRGARAGARLCAWCVLVAAHGVCNLARGDEACTVRAGGAWRAGAVPPVRRVVCVHSTVRLSRAGAGLRAWCALVTGHGAWNLARGGEVRTVRAGGAWRAGAVPPVRTCGASTARCGFRGPVRDPRGSHGARCVSWCEVARVVRACNRARSVQPRTGRRRAHGAAGRRSARDARLTGVLRTRVGRCAAAHATAAARRFQP